MRCLIGCLLFAAMVFADDITTKMTRTVKSAVPCVTIYTSTGAIGCASSKAGAVGTLLAYDGASMPTADKLTSFASTLGVSSAVIVLNYQDFSALKALASSSVIKGVLIVSDGSSNSPDALAPQGPSTPQGKVSGVGSFPWNEGALSLLWDKFDFPVSLVTDAGDISAATSGAASNLNLLKGGANGLYVAEMNSYMGPSATMTSTKCLASGDCHPLGGQSVWAHHGAGEDLAGNQIIIAAAPLDSMALFHDAASSAVATYSSLTALLVAAQALSKTDIATLPTKVVYAAFQGESWGMIGSRKFIDDVSNFKCTNVWAKSNKQNTFGRDICLAPLKMSLEFEKLALKNVKHVIALDQVGTTGEGSSTFYLHPTAAGKGFVNTILDASTSLPSGYSVKTSDVVSDLPPSPLSSFVTANSQISGVVLSGYNTKFTNKHFSSILDNADNVNGDAVIAAATALARSIYSLAGGQAGAAANIVVDPKLSNDLLNCFTKDASCQLFDTFTNFPKLPPAQSLKNYVSVYQMGEQPFIRTAAGVATVNFTEAQSDDVKVNWGIYSKTTFTENFVHNFLANVTATAGNVGGVCTGQADCTKESKECVAGRCILSNAHYHDAITPALKAKSSPSMFTIIDEKDPIFAEPNWGGSYGPNLSVVIYRVSNTAEDVTIGIIGLLVLVGSILFARYMRSQYTILVKLD